MAVAMSAFGLSAFFYSSISLLPLFTHAQDPTSAFLALLGGATFTTIIVGAIFIAPLWPTAASSEYATIPEEEVGPSVGAVTPRPEPAPRDKTTNISGFQLVHELDFWLLFACLGLMSGIGLMCEWASQWSRHLFYSWESLSMQTSTILAKLRGRCRYRQRQSLLPPLQLASSRSSRNSSLFCPCSTLPGDLSWASVLTGCCTVPPPHGASIIERTLPSPWRRLSS